VSDPVLILDLLAAVMLLVAAYCAARLAVVRRLRRTLHHDVNLAHVLMGVAMAGMLVPALNVLPDGLWEVVFAGLAAWFTWRSGSFISRHGLTGRSSDRIHGISHYLTHLVMSCSMLYMYLAGVPASADRAVGMAMGPAAGTADFVALPLFFVVVLTASAVWHIDALSRFTPTRVALVASTSWPTSAPSTLPGAEEEPRWLAPRLEMGCHIAVCVAMAFMLVLML
jgi:hypothetical protein